MISMSIYENYNSDKYRTYNISLNYCKDNEECCSELAPKISFWKKYQDNIGSISEEENKKIYIQEYWNQVLSKLDPEKVRREINNSILVSPDVTTGYVVAAWFEILLGVEIREIKVSDYEIKTIERTNDIKQILEDTIRSNIKKMRGFNSLRALYLFEKGERLEQLANEKEAKTGENCDRYRQAACYLRCDADEVEQEYNVSKQKVKK